jgi:HAE1 family hydrophobic/amphiphilic exporter-1
MGIVTKNAIMLVDFAVEEEKHGVPQKEAIIDAGRKRARPIIMTTIAMAAGMLPAAYGVGQGGEFRAPMAIAVIGGLLVSTVLSLVFIPSFYCLMDDLSRGIAKLFKVIARPNVRDEEGVVEYGTARVPRPAAVAHPGEPAFEPPVVVPVGPRLVAENKPVAPPMPMAAE